MQYKHTQVGTLIITVSLILVLLFGYLLTTVEYNSQIIIIMVLAIAILASFSALNSSIDKNYLKIRFGYGLYKRRFLLKEINSVEIVRNKWYYGWGIRVWFWPKMTIFNVSGFDAVEIIMNNSIRFRIGTDDPKGLETAIKQGMK